jgi:peptidoglycan/LPS O-acetylase OafA/YrhL
LAVIGKDDQGLNSSGHDSSNLDFLRAAAVLFVWGFHTVLYFIQTGAVSQDRLGGLYSIGRWGVLIFFVHTSLVLMFSLERLHERHSGRTVYHAFLVRRALRIFPLSVVLVLVAAASRMPVADVIHAHFVTAPLTARTVLTNVFLVQNLAHTPSIILQLWTLPIEMQMYLFLPLFFLIVSRSRTVLPAIALWLCALFGAMHAGHLERLGMPELVEFVPFFLAGVVAFAFTRVRSLRLPGWLWPAAVFAVTALYLEYPSNQRAWLAGIVLAVMIPQFRDMTNPAICRVSKLAARYSYGIYLTHFIGEWLAFSVCMSWPMWSRWLVLILSVVAMSVTLYHAIEAPMIKVGARLADRFYSRTPVLVASPKPAIAIGNELGAPAVSAQ